MNIRKDPQTGVLYLRLRPGRERDEHGVLRGLVEESIEIGEGAYLDIDADRRPVGVEFLSMEAFGEFLDRYPDGLEILEEEPTTPHGYRVGFEDRIVEPGFEAGGPFVLWGY